MRTVLTTTLILLLLTSVSALAVPISDSGTGNFAVVEDNALHVVDIATDTKKVEFSSGTVIIYDSGGYPAEVDNMTHTLQVIDYSHHEIHSGDHYFIAGTTDMGGSSTATFLFTVPNTTKWPHAFWGLATEAEATFSMYEGCAVSASGSQITPINNNRNSANTAGVTAFSGPTVNTNGTLVYSAKAGSGKQIGGSETHEHEFIGKQDTNYCFYIENDTVSNNWLSYDFFWYEHTSKVRP